MLLLVLPFAGGYAGIQLINAGAGSLPIAAGAAAFAIALGAVVLLARAATVGAASTGVLLAFCYGITPSYPHSLLWPLGAALALTLGCSRIGRNRKQQHAPDEGHARDTAQVAANLGAGALAGAALNAHGALAAHTAIVAALAELAADTLASELGQLSPWPPRMLLTGRVAAPGTDGAISPLGTAAALAGAAAVATVGMWACALPMGLAGVAVVCGFGGMVLDSILGQLLERRSLLHNDAVNFLSNAAAATAALLWAAHL